MAPLSGSGASSGASTLASYFPALELRQITAAPGEPTAPRIETVPAAVLFADLSGFTALAESLSAQGPRGAEELSRIIDAHFGRLTDTVLAAGGDVLAFAGDAALVAWAAEGTPLADAVAAAASAGLSLQGGTPSSAEATLRMRVAIGVGPLLHMRVGGVAGRWLFLASGTAIEQATSADRLAREGEVVLSPDAAALLDRRGEGTLLPDGVLRLTRISAAGAPPAPRAVPLATEETARLRRLVPEVIGARVDAGLGAWLGEFRQVTMVFCGLGDVDPARPEGLEVVHQAVRALQTEVARFEGTVYQLLTDDKGTTLVAAFGLPPRAHEDDAARGTLAALEMHAALGRLGLAAAIGIATGPLYCGVYGTSRRRQYTVAGSAVNLAARLMQHAAGSIRCDAVTEVRARRHPDLRFTPLPPVQVKGRAEPVTLFQPATDSGAAARVRGAKGDQQPQGRERECAALDAALEALAANRQGSVILIEGEPGIGKSRLIEYLQVAAARRGVRVLAAAGNDIDKATAYRAWTRPFRSLAGSDPSQVSFRLGLGAEQAPLLPLLAPLLGLDLGASDLVAAMTDEVRAANTRKLLLAALEYLGETGPVAVTIEDAHWLDTPSWALLLAAARTIPSLLFVVTSRAPDEPSPDFGALQELAAEHRIQLLPLEAGAVERMLAERLGVRSLPEPVLALVRERAAGNPFFSEELAYALRDYGLITITAGRCELTDPARQLAPAFAEALAARGLPPTVQGVVTSRIDRLSQTDQFTLKVAGVIGRSVPVAMLREVYPVPITDQELRASIAELEHHDLIRPDPGGAEPGFSFRHAITQQVAYDMTLYAQRRDLHRAVGEWLEARHRPDPAPVLPLLALHWRRAEVIPKAVHYLGRAGEQAFQSFANAEAVGFLQEALSLGTDAPADQRIGWEMQAGRACVNWSRYKEGEQHLEQALALAGERVPRGSVAVVGALLGQVLRQVLHRRFPDRFVGRRRGQREHLLSMARAHEALVEVFYLRDASLPCLHSAIRGLNLAELAGPSPELARGYATVGAILGFIPLPGLADAYCRRALETARESGDIAATVWTALTVGAYKLGVAAWDEAEALFKLVTGESGRLGDARRWDDGIQFLTDLDILRGDFPAGLELAASLYRSAAERNDPRGQASARYRQVLCHLALGQDADALSGSEELVALRWNAGTVHGDLPVRTVRGLTALRAGDLATAERAALEAAVILEKLTPAYHGYVFDAAGTAEVLLQLLERSDRATEPASAVLKRERALRSALRGLKRLARVFPIGRPWLAYLEGRRDRLRGKGASAVVAWRKALALGDCLGMPYPAALADLELARSLSATDPERGGRRESTRRRLTRLGAAHDLQRLEGPLQ